MSPRRLSTNPTLFGLARAYYRLENFVRKNDEAFWSLACLCSGHNYPISGWVASEIVCVTQLDRLITTSYEPSRSVA